MGTIGSTHAVLNGDPNERLLRGSPLYELSAGNWVCVAAELPVSLRPKGRRSRGMLPVLEADILNRGSDTRKPPEYRGRVCSVKTDRL